MTEPLEPKKKRKRRARQTHCRRGHDLDNALTVTRADGSTHRQCRACSRPWRATPRGRELQRAAKRRAALRAKHAKLFPPGTYR
jgi:hypothetical protein